MIIRIPRKIQKWNAIKTRDPKCRIPKSTALHTLFFFFICWDPRWGSHSNLQPHISWHLAPFQPLDQRKLSVLFAVLCRTIHFPPPIFCSECWKRGAVSSSVISLKINPNLNASLQEDSLFTPFFRVKRYSLPSALLVLVLVSFLFVWRFLGPFCVFLTIMNMGFSVISWSKSYFLYGDCSVW